jgi:hypothetical protein
VQIIVIHAIMGIFEAIRGRNDDGRFTRSLVDTHGMTEHEDKNAQAAVATSTASNAEELPFEDAGQHRPTHNFESSYGIHGIEDDTNEVDRNPGHVTDQAGLGQQKAEAAALVWSRPVVFLIYAW